MTEQQKTFGPVVGLDPVVSTRPHNDDIVECSNGTLCKRSEANYDCQDNPHFDAEDCFYANVAIVTDILDGIDGWVCAYCTENSDYAEGAAYIVQECSHDWPVRVREWLESNCIDYNESMVEQICENLENWEVEYDGNEYAAYSGSGLCLLSLDIGEYEEQTDISAFPELKALHDQGILDDILDHYKGDAYVSRRHRREKNPDTGYYENVGRETYDPYGSDHPDILTYHNPGGQWHYVVPRESIEEIIEEALDN